MGLRGDKDCADIVVEISGIDDLSVMAGGVDGEATARY